jgi:DNA-binding IclR family transcriptional regulator
MSETGSRVKSAERTLDVLELLASAMRPLPTMCVARRCGVPKSSMHHLLNVMRDRGWVLYHPELRGWSLGPAAVALGQAGSDSLGSNGSDARWSATRHRHSL